MSVCYSIPPLYLHMKVVHKNKPQFFSCVLCIYGDLNETHDDLVKVLVYMYFIDEALHKVVMHFCCHLLPTKACLMTICYQFCQMYMRKKVTQR